MSDDEETEFPAQAPISSIRPDIELNECIAMGKTHQVDPPFLLGLRCERPADDPAKIYYDAICMVDSITFETFNANTNPSKHGRGMATIVAPQTILYKIGIHNVTKEKEKQYQALVQASPIKVTREGIGEVPPGWFGINIHRGGISTPGSEGCQTLPPTEWPLFMKCVWQTIRMRNIYAIKYLLVEEK